MLCVKKAADNIVDVFTGEGWNNWSRFEVQHNHGKLLLKLVKGVPMSKPDFRSLYESLNK